MEKFFKDLLGDYHTSIFDRLAYRLSRNRANWLPKIGIRIEDRVLP